MEHCCLHNPRANVREGAFQVLDGKAACVGDEMPNRRIKLDNRDDWKGVTLILIVLAILSFIATVMPRCG